MHRLFRIAVLASLAFATPLFAQAPRTFVSSTGSDANPCSRIAPCRNFQAAMTAVAAGGEVVALDSAGYGPFTVDRPVTVTADGVHAAVTSALDGTAVVIGTASPSDVVILRNLALLANGSFSKGVVLQAVAVSLSIENCSLSGFATAVDFRFAGTGELHVRNCVFLGGSNGVDAENASGGARSVTVDHSTFEATETAVAVVNGVTGVVTDSITSGSDAVGQGQFAAVTNAVLTVLDCFVVSNQIGIGSFNSSTVRVGNSTIAHNGTGLLASNGGTIISLTGNHLAANGTDGSFNSTVTLH